MNRKLSGGYYQFVDSVIGETQFLRAAVLEEVGSCQRLGRVLRAKESRKKRVILTAVYILTHFVLLTACWMRSDFARWCTILTFVYSVLYRRFDPVTEVCNAVMKQPDREIRQVVYEMTDEQPPRRLLPVGITAFVLSILLFFGITANEQYDFSPVDGGYSISGYRSGLLTTVTQIPETYQGQPVVAIGDRAFEGASTLTQIGIPESVTRIGSYAFKGCVKLNQIKLPEGLLELNGGSFLNCESLTEITIPEGVTEIRGNTFEGCRALKNVELHEGIIDIHAFAFRNCRSLEQIALPSGITKIKESTFEYCTSLQSIHIPSGVTKISAHAFYGCSSLDYVYVPDTVQIIGSSAFRDCRSLKYIGLPDGVEVDERAFLDSPTEIATKLFTDAQYDEIIREAENKIVDTLYYVYKKDMPDTVVTMTDGTITIADNKLIETLIPDSHVVQSIDSNSAMLAYLEAVRDAGVTEVTYYIYSPMASQITGGPYFLSKTLIVEDMIEIARVQVAEETND
ncbi:MAG: leucine-rich repeat domain-containing protein [Oscillospiraceae bacterium]|nr:leucine-rich repeat domain-containing protein [Oscillospiraceae bacterium]